MPKLLCRLDHRLAADQLLQLHRGGVEAQLQGPPQGGDAVVLAVVVLRTVGELALGVGKQEGASKSVSAGVKPCWNAVR